MSSIAAHIRMPSEMGKMYNDVLSIFKNVLNEYKNADIYNIIQVFRMRDMLLTQVAVLSAKLVAVENIGTRGGSMVYKTEFYEDDIFNIKKADNSLFDDKTIIKNEASMENKIRDIRPIPEVDLWFENVWTEYNDKWNIG